MKNQTCNFCENPEVILSRNTCCAGCSKIPDAYQPERSKREDLAYCIICKTKSREFDGAGHWCKTCKEYDYA